MGNNVAMQVPEDVRALEVALSSEVFGGSARHKPRPLFAAATD
jgi:hypothetical protein